MPTALVNLLANNGVRSIEQFVEWDEEQLAALKGVGPERLRHLLTWRERLRGPAVRLVSASMGGPGVAANTGHVNVRVGEETGEAVAAASCLGVLLEEALDGCGEVDRRVLESSLGRRGKSKRLTDIAKALGVTRERVRQRKARALSAIIGYGDLGTQLKQRVLRLRTGRDEPLFVELLPAEDPWFEACQEVPGFLARVIDEIGTNEFHVWPLDGLHVISSLSVKEWESLVRSASAAARKADGLGHAPDEVQVLVEAIAHTHGAADLRLPLWRAAARVIPPRVLNDADLQRGDRVEWRRETLSVPRTVGELLRAADRPMRVREVHKRCEALLGRALTGNAIRQALRLAGGWPLRRGLYGHIHHCHLSRGDAERIVHAALQAMQAVPARQWHVEELYEEVRRREPSLMSGLGVGWINVLLAEYSPLSYLGRNVWVSSDYVKDHSGERLDISRLCQEALAENGTPMTTRELRRALARQRGLPKHFQVSEGNGIVRKARGLWMLAEWQGREG